MQTKYLLNGKEINLTSDNVIIKSDNFNVDKNGNLNCNSGTMKDVVINGGKIELNSTQYTSMKINGSHGYMSFDDNAIHMYDQSSDGGLISIQHAGQPMILVENKSGDFIGETVIVGNHIKTGTITQTSLKELKKNFEKLNNGIDTIKNIDIYKYNLKSEADGSKKHIGFIIGDNYNYSKVVTSNNNDGVDIYSFVSVCCKAIQEQQEQIETLQEELNKLKGEQ